MRYFKKEEFWCPCCGKEKMQPDFLLMMDTIRMLHGGPLYINSGWRCESHNTDIGGALNSAHPRGWAVDISVLGSRKRYELMSICFRVGITRMGVMNTALHIDMDPDLPQNVIWDYYG
jgi:zinc D-Ala-D-Ala carboxypeptidase